MAEPELTGAFVQYVHAYCQQFPEGAGENECMEVRFLDKVFRYHRVAIARYERFIHAALSDLAPEFQEPGGQDMTLVHFNRHHQKWTSDDLELSWHQEACALMGLAIAAGVGVLHPPIDEYGIEHFQVILP